LDIELVDGDLKAEMVAWNYTDHLDLEVPKIPAPKGIIEKVEVIRE
jgi:hypothetical protein